MPNWDLTTEEYFYFDDWEYDVRAAKRAIIKGRYVITSCKPKGFSQLLKTIDIIARRGHQIDLSVPVLIVSHFGLDLPIDGWHRIRKALRCRIKSLPCIHLGEFSRRRW